MQHRKIDGALVELCAKGCKRPLDGFWARSDRRSPTLAIFVHGMHSNFYRSAFKKAFLRLLPARGIDVLSFNNRGAEHQTADEVFEHCRFDLDSAIAFGRSRGYRRFILIGHSTGCQKALYYVRLRRPLDVQALVFAAPGDDYAIARRELGARFSTAVRVARRMVNQGQGRKILRLQGEPAFLGFTARRFLSIADPSRIEARLFRFEGPMAELGSLQIPALVLLPEREQYACMPIPAMAERLCALLRSPNQHVQIVPGADHSFHGKEMDAARRVARWLAGLGLALPRSRGSRKP